MKKAVEFIEQALSVFPSNVETISNGSLTAVARTFLKDAQRRVTENTLRDYAHEVIYFIQWAVPQGITTMDQLNDTRVIGAYLSKLTTHRNPGGQFAGYRVLKTFTYWWERQTDEEWRSPFHKIKGPRVPEIPPRAIAMGDFDKMIEACNPSVTPGGLRNKAILYALLDTGCRAQEFCDMRIVDLDYGNGTIMIPKSKSGHPRIVFIGNITRKAIMKYVSRRRDKCEYLWIKVDGNQLTKDSLRDIVVDVAERAHVAVPGLHDFRRTFALNFLRNNPNDLISLQRLMGHRSLRIIERYVAFTVDDLSAAHQRGSPVDGRYGR